MTLLRVTPLRFAKLNAGPQLEQRQRFAPHGRGIGNSTAMKWLVRSTTSTARRPCAEIAGVHHYDAALAIGSPCNGCLVRKWRC